MENNILTQFNEGGTHEENSLGGVPLGQNALVEQGETKKDNYIYSNRITIPSSITKEMNLPNYIKNKTFAEASKIIDNKFKDRNDKPSLNTKKEFLERLTQAQEHIKNIQNIISENKKFDRGGYYDNFNPFFTNNPGEQQGPKNEGNITEVASQGFEMAASNGLLGSNVQEAMGSAIPGSGVLGAAQGALALNDLSQGKGASRNGVKSALTGAATGAMAGSTFGPIGTITGGVIGLGAGMIGSSNRRKADAEIGRMNAKNANAVFRDTKYNFAFGGPLNKPSYLENIYNKYGNTFSEGTLDNAELSSNLADAFSKTQKIGPITNPAENNFTNNFGEPNRVFNPVKNPDAYNSYSTYSNLGKTPGIKNPNNFLSKVGDVLNNNVGAESLRYSPVLANLMQMNSIKKPGYEALNRLSNTYKPQYMDEETIQNIISSENRNIINGLSNSSEGSGSTIRANMLGANLNMTKARSDAYMKMREYNNNQNSLAQNFKLDVDKTNLSQSNLENDINARNKGNYDTQRSKFLGEIGTELGQIGKEKLFAKKAGQMFGYDENGKYLLNPDGNKTYVEKSENNIVEKNGKYYDKTGKELTAADLYSMYTKKAFGGYIKKTKTRY